LLIKYIKSVLWKVAKYLSYIEDARCLNVNSNNSNEYIIVTLDFTQATTDFLLSDCGPLSGNIVGIVITTAHDNSDCSLLTVE